MPEFLHSRTRGRGQKLVLLHPVGLDGSFWDAVCKRLEPSYQMTCFDLPGHGLSAAPEPGYSLFDYASDVHRSMEHLDLGPAVIVGLSFGGMVAQCLALAHAQCVKAVVICGCPCEFPSANRQMISDRGKAAVEGGMGAVVNATMERWFTQDFLGTNEAEAVRQRLLAQDVSGWNAAWQAISQLDNIARLSGLSMPVLCIAGEKDAAISSAMVRNIADHVPNASFVELPNSPHMMHIETPDLFSKAIDDFVRGLSN